jgi:hypothetical protein
VELCRLGCYQDYTRGTRLDAFEQDQQHKTYRLSIVVTWRISKRIVDEKRAMTAKQGLLLGLIEALNYKDEYLNDNVHLQ